MPEKYIKFLREQAKALEATDPKAAKVWSDMASEMEKAVATDTVEKQVEETIAARIKAGDLVAKATHAEAVAAAEKKGREAALKEVEDKAALEKKTVEVRASRLKQIGEAGLDLKGVTGKDKTIESETSAIGVDEAGEKLFASKLEDWVTVMKTTGQFKSVASNKGDADKNKVPPMAGSNGSENSGKKAIAFC